MGLQWWMATWNLWEEGKLSMWSLKNVIWNEWEKREIDYTYTQLNLVRIVLSKRGKPQIHPNRDVL